MQQMGKWKPRDFSTKDRNYFIYYPTTKESSVFRVLFIEKVDNLNNVYFNNFPEMSVVFGVRQHSGRSSGIPKRFQCPFCSYSSDQSGNLRTHMASHSGRRPYSCSQCGSAFTLKHHLRDHMIVHTGERPFECETCGVAFGRKSHLRRHSRVHFRNNK